MSSRSRDKLATSAGRIPEWRGRTARRRELNSGSLKGIDNGSTSLGRLAAVLLRTSFGT